MRSSVISERQAIDHEAKPVLIARCRSMGLRPTADNLKIAMDPRLATLLGRYRVIEARLGKAGISQEQYQAGIDYERCKHMWLSCKGLSVVKLSDSPLSYGEIDPAEIIKIEAKLLAAEKALLDAGHECKKAVSGVIFGGYLTGSLKELRDGLDALHNHFRARKLSS